MILIFIKKIINIHVLIFVLVNVMHSSRFSFLVEKVSSSKPKNSIFICVKSVELFHFKKKIEYGPCVLLIIYYEVAWLKILRNRNWQSLMSNWIHRLLFSDQTPVTCMILIRNLAVSNVCMYNPNSICTILPVLKCKGPSTLWTVISVNISVYTTRLNTRNTRNLIYELGFRDR